MIDKHKLIGRMFRARPGTFVPMTQEEMDYFNRWLEYQASRGNLFPDGLVWLSQ
jgi:hypothetical protein